MKIAEHYTPQHIKLVFAAIRAASHHANRSRDDSRPVSEISITSSRSSQVHCSATRSSEDDEGVTSISRKVRGRRTAVAGRMRELSLASLFQHACLTEFARVILCKCSGVFSGSCFLSGMATWTVCVDECSLQVRVSVWYFLR